MPSLSLFNKKFFYGLIIIFVCILLGKSWLFFPEPLLIVVLGLLPFALVFVLSFTHLMVLLFVIFSFCRIHEAIPVLSPLRLPQLLALASLFSLAWHLFITNQIKIFWCKELKALSWFFACVTVGVLMASNRPIAMEAFTGSYVKIIIMTFAIAWLIRTEGDFKLSIYLFCFGGLIVGIVALFNKMNGIGLVEGTRVTVGRDIGSILGDPNDLALVLMFPISFAMGLTMTSGLGRLPRMLGLCCTIILFSAIIATQSRGGLLGVMAVFGVYFYRRIESKVLFVSLGVVALLGLFILAGISGRSSGGAAEAGVDASAMGRLYAWEAAIGMALDNPITGVGIKNFYSNYFFYSNHWDGLNHAVHSTWFGVLAETGILGFILFVYMIVVLVRVAIKNADQAELAADTSPIMVAVSQSNLSAIAAIAVSGTFLTQGFTWPVYVVGALITAFNAFINRKD